MIDTVEHKDKILSKERKCIVTGEIRDRDEMYRFIIDPDNQILPDLAAKLPGRGFWVSANQSSLRLAIEKNLFEKSAKKSLKIKKAHLHRECRRPQRSLHLPWAFQRLPGA